MSNPKASPTVTRITTRLLTEGPLHQRKFLHAEKACLRRMRKAGAALRDDKTFIWSLPIEAVPTEVYDDAKPIVVCNAVPDAVCEQQITVAHAIRVAHENLSKGQRRPCATFWRNLGRRVQFQPKTVTVTA